jgi:hypothetical protein
MLRADNHQELRKVRNLENATNKGPVIRDIFYLPSFVAFSLAPQLGGQSFVALVAFFGLRHSDRQQDRKF